MGTPAGYDVAVVGGGSAGIAAALAASRRGARTLLLEASGVLGGNASHAWVHTICGLYHPASEGEAVPAHAGFPARFAEGLRAVGGARAPERAGRVWVLPTHPPAIPAYAEALCRAEHALTLMMRRALSGASFAAGQGWHELALEPGGERGNGDRVRARVVVDASGDAALAAALGAEIETAAPHELQIPSYIFRMTGVDTRDLEGFARLRVTHAVAGAARAGELPSGCESVLVRRGAESDEVYVTLNVPRPADYDPLDAQALAALEARARADAERLAAFLRRTREAFARSRVLAWPARIGVRESRRVCGRARVEREDVLGGRRRDDEVAISTWPIELWPDHRRARFEHPAAACSIPLGALVSRSHPRLAMAGRCLSASHSALGALRVIGTALATGEAAGTAAALAADRGSDLDAIAPDEIRAEILRSWA
jgi:glycine/D-amino acid oxidase-like deaminating enzyme